jgi:hypothetical protein
VVIETELDRKDHSSIPKTTIEKWLKPLDIKYIQHSINLKTNIFLILRIKGSINSGVIW